MGDKNFDILQGKWMKNFAEMNGLVICTCKNMFYLEKGEVDLKSKTDEGKIISQ